VAVFAPTVVERVHPQETRPEAVVDVVQEDSVPLAADQETVTLGTGLEYWSLTTATIFEDTAVPTVADWLLPELTEIVAAASAVPVAEKLAGVATPEVEAVAVFEPAVVESVHEHETRPEESVVVVHEERVPLAADQVTAVLGTTLLY